MKHNVLKPLWLGTHFINDLERFEVLRMNQKNYLLNSEQNDKAERFRRIYQWDDFGFELIKQFNE